MEDNQLMNTQNTQITEAAAASNEPIMGFDEAHSEDTIIPRIKVINALSPERTDGEATEGDIINSLTKESVVGKRFIPIKVFYSNIEWNPDRDDDTQRMFCRSFDGIKGTCFGADGNNTERLCKECRRNCFDNSKVGKEAQPKCTAYMNFLGFFEDDPMPVVVSFSRTNYNEGKKLLSIARSLRRSIWCYSYTFSGKQVTKGKQKWFIITAALDTPTSVEEQQLATEFFKMYNEAQIRADLDDDTKAVAETPHIDETTAEEI